VLVIALDPDTHERLDENQLADELITFLIAGHGACTLPLNTLRLVAADTKLIAISTETTAASLAFTCYLISQHPDVEQKVIDEVNVPNHQRPVCLLCT
jgi:cytochrome P450